MNYCLYHANCRDGFGAAYAVWKKYGDNFKYIPVSYQKDLPSMPDADKIMIVDFSYPTEVLDSIICNGIVVIDHHDTCPQNDPRIIFNKDNSGAVATWKYLFPGITIPQFLLYIQDRDLWKWELPGSRIINDGIESIDMDFNIWDKINISYMYERGQTIGVYKKKLIDDCMKHVWISNVFGYENVPCCPTMGALSSELGEALYMKYTNAPFVLLYMIGENSLICSLRTNKEDIHLGELCKKYGGGGHAKTAGFKKPLNGFNKEILQ